MKFEINDVVSYTEMHGEIVLANMETGLYFSIGGSGKHIWESLVKGEEVETLINTLTERYQVEKHTVSKDVNEFLADLEHHKFIQRRGGKIAT